MKNPPLYAVSPGSVLRQEMQESLGITQDQLASAMGVSRLTINEIVNEKRSVTAEMALKLAKALGTDPRFWLNLQQDVDLVRARTKLGAMRDVKVLRKSNDDGLEDRAAE
jgi:addiction module HigA family antidote